MSETTTDHDRLLAVLPTDGSRMGNYVVMRKLGWDEERYWRIRDALLDEGRVARGPGKGGSVGRVVPATPVIAPVEATADRRPKKPRAATTAAEGDLYEPIAKVLREEWARERRLQNGQFYVDITANQGSRATGGRWTRPDITLVSMKSFRYVPGRHFDVWTFEVKPRGAMDVTGVFEAAAHSRMATRSYAMFHVEEGDVPDEVLDRCVEEARRFEIGLVTFTDPAHFASWEIHVDAARQDADPELLDEFIRTQLSESAKDLLLRWRS